MNIGDRVRLIKGSEEGVVTKLLGNNMVEVEIEDGFGIPVLIQDLARVYSEESSYFETKRLKPDKEERPKVTAEKGLFMAFEALEDNKLRLILINNTDFDCPFSVSEKESGIRIGIEAGCLRPKSHTEIKMLSLESIEKWPEFEFTILFSRKGQYKFQPPFIKSYKFKSKRFFKSPVPIPMLSRQGYYFQIDQEASELDFEIVQNAIAENREKVVGALGAEDKLPKQMEVDLHWEELWPDAPAMSNADILDYQLKHFEKTLDEAIYKGCEEITFIHGVGQGKLRMEMHRMLSRNNQIRSFKDAQKEKFGYGATLVRIK